MKKYRKFFIAVKDNNSFRQVWITAVYAKYIIISAAVHRANCCE
jgi:hypothetical protein